MPPSSNNSTLSPNEILEFARTAQGSADSVGRTLFALTGQERAPDALEMTRLQEERADRASLRNRIQERAALALADKQLDNIVTQNRANKDVEAIVKGFNGGLFTQQVADNAMEQVVNEHGVTAIADSPMAQDWFGIRSQIEEQKSQLIKQKAEQLDAPEHFFKWDDNRGEPVPDQSNIQMEYALRGRDKLEITNLQEGGKVIREQHNALAAIVDAQRKAGEEPDAGVLKQLDALRREMFAHSGRMREVLGLPQPFKNVGQQQPPQQPAGQTPQEAVQSTPAAPAAPGTKSFNSQDALAEAFSAGKVQRNKPFMLAGQLVFVDDNDQVRPVSR